MTIWFTADTHFGRDNVIHYCKRPVTSSSEMDDQLIKNWNQAVKPDDFIYHLGDFTLFGKEPAKNYFHRLNGRIQVIPGGHDHRWLGKSSYYSGSGHLVTILPPLHTIKVSLTDFDQPQFIILCHYSLRFWDRSHYDSWHLYGHSHGNLPPLDNSLDVGVDCWDYHPVSLETIRTNISKNL